MQFFVTWTPDEAKPPTMEEMSAIAKFGEEQMKAGTLVSTGGMFPSSFGARVRHTKGKYTVTDGPFPETKEVFVGWAIYQVASKAEAINLSETFMAIVGDGVCEIRQLTDSPPQVA